MDQEIAHRSCDESAVLAEAFRRLGANLVEVAVSVNDSTMQVAAAAGSVGSTAGQLARGSTEQASNVEEVSSSMEETSSSVNQSADNAHQTSAGALLQQILPDVQKTAELVEEIDAAGGEQSRGVQQISEAIRQLDNVIQQNAGAAEEMASTSVQLSSEARDLEQAVAFFKLGGRSAAHRSAAPRTEVPTLRPAGAGVPPAGRGVSQDCISTTDDDDFERIAV